MESVIDYHDVEMPNFSFEEAENLLSYFKKKKWITKGRMVL